MKIPYPIKLFWWRVYLRAYYYHTRHWKDTARLKRESVGGKCEICHLPKKTDVHHLHYHSLGVEKLIDLQACCRECHNALHER